MTETVADTSGIVKNAWARRIQEIILWNSIKQNWEQSGGDLPMAEQCAHIFFNKQPGEN